MDSYNPEQLERYFSLISLDDWKKLIGKDVRAFFDKLVKCHLARITDMGGYCFELNVFFLHLIRSLGFDAMAVGCRMRDQRSTSDGLDRWRTTSHMAILVMINGERFLVDVGCGIQSPVTPLLLWSGQTATGLTDQLLKVEFKKLAPTAMSKPVWIYSMRQGGQGPWKEIYAFADTEFLPSDFEVLNYYTLHASPFTRIVVVQNIFFNRMPDGSSGTLSLVNNRITQCIRGVEEPVGTLQSENERIEAFRIHFGISLSGEELAAMEGSPYALPVAR